MIKINQIVIFSFFLLLFCSCNGQVNTNDTCKRKFKEARDLAYSNSTRQSALDSAMNLANECMQCDSIRKAVVDFKITLLTSMKKYVEGISFINSLNENDFTYRYKQKLKSKSLQALDYNYKRDTIKQNLVYKEITNDLEQYIMKENISGKEFKEIYTDLFAVKKNYLDANQINKDVENLKKLYPDKETFFDFFKK